MTGHAERGTQYYIFYNQQEEKLAVWTLGTRFLRCPRQKIEKMQRHWKPIIPAEAARQETSCSSTKWWVSFHWQGKLSKVTDRNDTWKLLNWHKSQSDSSNLLTKTWRQNFIAAEFIQNKVLWISFLRFRSYLPCNLCWCGHSLSFFNSAYWRNKAGNTCQIFGDEGICFTASFQHLKFNSSFWLLIYRYKIW